MRIAAGFLIWIAILGVVARWVTHSPGGPLSPIALMFHYVSRGPTEISLFLRPPRIVAVGDPIYLSAAGDQQTPIGRITRIQAPSGERYQIAFADRVEAELYSDWQQLVGADSTGELAFQVYETPKSMGWVVQTMLPRQKRLELAAEIVNALKEHQPAIVSRLQPLVLKSLQDSGEVIRGDLRAAIAKRQDQFQRLAGRYQVEIMQEQLVPLFSDVIWPIVREESWPLATKIGQEAWNEASLWRLSWRYLYDLTPLPERNLAQKEFERLIEERLSPKLVQWLPDIYAAQQKILTRISSNEQVRETAANILALLANDVELQGLVMEVLREALTDNPRLLATWQDVWKSDEAKAALDEMSSRLEPTIAGLGEAMFGNPRTQITPEFSTVLRNKVLFKDERWLTVRPRVAGDPAVSADGRIDVVPGPVPASTPFHVPARPRQ